MRFYLISQEGLRSEKAFPIEGQVTVGRAQENDIHLTDPSVSRQHAVVYLSEGKPIVEDLESSNGTFVNEEEVKKAFLKSGDTVRMGKAALQFFQEDEVGKQIDITDTRVFELPDLSSPPHEESPLPKSRRLIDAVAAIPAFSSLSEEGLEQICRGAKLIVFDKGKTIVRYGDWAQCLFIILDGKVRMFTYDHLGKELDLHLLSENQFFGESSLLAGGPYTAMVQAVEETLLCRLDFEALLRTMQEFPLVKGILEQQHLERARKGQEKKKKAGFEQRGHPRYRVDLPLSFSVSPSSEVPTQFTGKTFQTVCADISNSGVRIRVKDRSLLELPVGCDLRLEIALPKHPERIRCIGTVRHVIDAKAVKDIVYLGVEFFEMLPEDRKKLEHFLYSSPTTRMKRDL
jgi:hypothetical protein